MSMRRVSPWMTLCEIFRKLNERSQSNSQDDTECRELCVLGMIVAKRMSLELPKEKTLELARMGPFHQNKEESIRKRTSLGFKDDWCRREEIKKKYGMEE